MSNNTETPNPADLVGRTFERDGACITILSEDATRVYFQWNWEPTPPALHCSRDEMSLWLAGAVEVKENNP